MAELTLGKAYVQIIPSAKGIKNEMIDTLGEEVTSAGKKTGHKLGTRIISTLKSVIIGAGIGQIISNSITAGGELEQNLGGTEAVFGSFASKIKESANDAYKNMGLSASDYMATANKMGSLFQGSGMEQQKSLDLTASAMQRAADVASVMGLDTSMAMESIAGAAKGNFTMMDNLGVAMNATALGAYALEQGINFDWNTASQAEKSELAMKMFMDRTSQYAGNFARESEETFSGSLGAMKTAFTNVLATISTGGDWQAALGGLMDSTKAFIQNVMPMLAGVLTELPTALITAIAEVAPVLVETGAKLLGDVMMGWGNSLPTLTPILIDTLLMIVTILIDNMPLLVDGALQLIVGFTEGLISAIPVIIEKLPLIIKSIVEGLIILLPVIIDAGVQLLTAIIEDLPVIIQTIVDALPEIIDSIIDAIMDNLPLLVEAGVLLFIALIEKLPEIILELIKAVPEIIEGIVNAFDRLMYRIVEIGGDIVAGLWEGIKSLAGWLWDKVAGWISSIWDGIMDFFGIHSPSKEMAWVGEMLNKGLAEGIQDNVKPVTKAIDTIGRIATQSFESDMALSATASDSVFTSSIQNGFNPSDNFNYQKLASMIGQYVTQAFIHAGVKVEMDYREVGRLVQSLEWEKI